MPHIEQLAAHVADRIAAGEVVERPASVMKELLENAVDAGASCITAEIQNGGMTYLRVSDDGCGIEKDELPTAFLRHATSKLRSAEELAAIGTLGFRGEALAAIAAVSRVDIFTRPRGALCGASLRLEGGAAGTVEEAGCPEGTSIVVRDLFFNTPARLKFMKRDSAEAAAIVGLVGHLSLSHPELSFRLLKDGEEVLHTPGDGVLKNAIYAALGREFALHLAEVHGRCDALSCDGFITEPLAGRGTRGMQTFFVNGRIVKSQLLTTAVEAAYENRIMRGKYPGCVLNLTLPCDMVDVNVHPAKTVVKFVNEKAVFDVTYHAACAALETEKQPEKRAEAPKREDFFRSMTAQEFRAAAEPPKIRYYDSELSGKMKLSDVLPRSAGESVPAAPPQIRKPIVPPQEKPTAPEEPPAVSEEPEQQSLLPEAAPWRIAGEVLNTYIVCEDGEKNVWLIDKHAAHERINFDRFQAQAEPIVPQALLTPLVADFPAAEYAALTEQLPLLREFGFTCEEFGSGSLLIREVPADLAAADAIPALEDLAGRLLAGRADAASARDALLHTMACKAAIKGGWKTSEEELRALVDRVQSGEVKFCPHGRPVAVKLTQYALEKMFGRA